MQEKEIIINRYIVDAKQQAIRQILHIAGNDCIWRAFDFITGLPESTLGKGTPRELQRWAKRYATPEEIANIKPAADPHAIDRDLLKPHVLKNQLPEARLFRSITDEQMTAEFLRRLLPTGTQHPFNVHLARFLREELIQLNL
jgi:hypothetical protein